MVSVRAIAGAFVILTCVSFVLYIFGQLDTASYTQGVNSMGVNVYKTPEYTVISTIASSLAVITLFVALIYVIRHSNRSSNPYAQ